MNKKAINAKPIAHRAYKEARKAVFLRAFKNCGRVNKAAKVARVNQDTIWDWRNNDPKFAEDFQAAIGDMKPLLEVKGLDMAFRGSEQILKFLLQAADPKKYGNKLTHELASDQLDELISLTLQILQRSIPEHCPGCKTNLNLKAAIAEEMMQLSSQFKSHKDGVKA